MKTAYEAVVHTAVMAPVFLLAGAIETMTRVCRTAAGVANRVAGEPRRPASGLGTLRTA